jgi:diacylglycerol kinase family enzyme
MMDTLPSLLGPRTTPFDLRFHGPRGREHDSAQLILVSNNPYRLDRLAGIGSRPRLDSGLLGIIAVNIPNATAAAELAALETLGQPRRFPGWREWTADQFVIDSSQAVAAGIDGEAVTLQPPLNFRTAASALRVRLPPTAAALSPAALTPGFTRAALHELLQLATGRK